MTVPVLHLMAPDAQLAIVDLGLVLGKHTLVAC